MDKIKICALGGLDEAGRDCYVIEINDDIFVVEAGDSLPDKTIPGVDYLLPNAEYLISNASRIKAYIITHGHEEAMAALKYFYKQAPAPVYCTLTTKQCMEGEADLLNFPISFDFRIVKATDNQVINGHTIHFFETCHNVAESFGVAFETDRGNIVFTSDFIVDYTINEPNYIFDLKSLARISEKETLLLMATSKGASNPGYCSPKHRVVYLIEKYFKDDNKRIFVSCFWQNPYRVRAILSLCKKYKKKVYFFDEFTKKTMKFVVPTNSDVMPHLEILESENLLRVKEQDVVVLILGHESDIYDKIKNLAMGANEDKRLSLGVNDIFIGGAIATPTQEVAATHALDSLYRTGCQVVWLKKKDLFSMHARQDDLKVFLSLLKPKFYLPVRGTYINLMDNAKLALSMDIGLNHSNVFIIDNGMQIEFNDGNRPKIIPNEVNKIPTHPILVDGTGISKVGAEVIEERRQLGYDGTVVVAATINLNTKRIIAGPDCQMRGFVYVKEAEPLLKTISSIYIDEVNTMLNSPRIDLKKTEEMIKERVRRFIKRENGRDPMILPIIIEEK